MREPQLKPRSLLFTLYGDYVLPLSGGGIRIGALVQLAADLGVSAVALRSAVSRMGREGWLSAERRRGRPHYSLSATGRALIQEGTRRIYGRRKRWGGRWLLVSYSLPEGRRHQRDRLRSGLSFLGFGSLGNGLYLSPHDVRQELARLFAAHGVEGAVIVHHGDLEWPRDPAQVVARAWNLRALDDMYADFEARTRRALAVDRALLAARRLSDREAFCRRFRLTHEFRHFPFSDPDLPPALLPPGWSGSAARRAFLSHHRLLRRPAERHYRQAAG